MHQIPHVKDVGMQNLKSIKIKYEMHAILLIYKETPGQSDYQRRMDT